MAYVTQSEPHLPGGPPDQLWHMASSRQVTEDPLFAEGITVWSAGGMVWRRSETGDVEVVVCYRPYRVDWSFPKGKLQGSETFEEAAIREVFEETGLHCALGTYVGFVNYVDRKDRPKVVIYWLMEVTGGEFTINDEVSELRWVPVDEARQLVTYDRDRSVLNLFSRLEEVQPLRTSPSK